MLEQVTSRHGLVDCLLQQRQGLGSPSGERIGRSQGGSHPGDCEPDVCHLYQTEGAFEHGDGLREFPLSQQTTAHGHIRCDTTEGVIDSLGNPHRFLGWPPALGKGAALSKGVGQVRTGVHGA